MPGILHKGEFGEWQKTPKPMENNKSYCGNSHWGIQCLGHQKPSRLICLSHDKGRKQS